MCVVAKCQKAKGAPEQVLELALKVPAAQGWHDVPSADDTESSPQGVHEATLPYENVPAGHAAAK